MRGLMVYKGLGKEVTDKL